MNLPWPTGDILSDNVIPHKITHLEIFVLVANEAMSTLFAMNLRISLSSIVMYFIANMADIFVYDSLRIKTQGRKMWLRNNVATITCNCLENFFFILFGFYGMYDFAQCMQVAFSVSVIEAIVGLCDTPFLYLAVGKDQRRFISL